MTVFRLFIIEWPFLDAIKVVPVLLTCLSTTEILTSLIYMLSLYITNWFAVLCFLLSFFYVFINCSSQTNASEYYEKQFMQFLLLSKRHIYVLPVVKLGYVDWLTSVIGDFQQIFPDSRTRSLAPHQTALCFLNCEKQLESCPK